MKCSMSGSPVLHYLLEFAQTHVHWVDDVIQPSPPLAPHFPPVLNLFQHQGLFQWVSSSNQVAKVLELQLQHQSFQWIHKVDFLKDWRFDILAVQGTLQSLLQQHRLKASILQHYNKIPETGWLINERNLFFTVLEAGNTRLSDSMVAFWWRPFADC